MAFSKASRDVVALSGTETGKMPDYMKWADARTASKESAASRLSSSTNHTGKNRPGLPDGVPLKREEHFHRVGQLSAQSLERHNKTYNGSDLERTLSYVSTGNHPLERPSGRMLKSTTPIPEPEKITTKSIDKEESMKIRRSTFQERNINRMQGRGFSDEHFLGKHA